MLHVPTSKTSISMLMSHNTRKEVGNFILFQEKTFAARKNWGGGGSPPPQKNATCPCYKVDEWRKKGTSNMYILKETTALLLKMKRIYDVFYWIYDASYCCHWKPELKKYVLKICVMLLHFSVIGFRLLFCITYQASFRSVSPFFRPGATDLWS